VIGHLKDDHRMRRNHLKARDGDRINAVLAAAGYNFSLLRRWFAELLRGLLWILFRRLAKPPLRKTVLRNVLHERLVDEEHGQMIWRVP
jgi:IS5 family transposase